MGNPPEKTRERLLYVMHLAFVEIRLLALAKKNDQIHHLADTMELIPELMKDWNDQRMNEIRGLIETYHQMYPATDIDFMTLLDGRKPPPDRW